MTDSKLLLSALLVPALVLQGGSTCTGNGSAPSLNATVTGIETFNYATATLYNFTVSSVSSAGYFVPNTTYGAWCTFPNGLTPGGGTGATGIVTPPEDPSNPSGSATYTPIDSYSITATGNDYGFPGLIWNTASASQGTTSLTLAQEWSAVNWILNFPSGSSGKLEPTTTDTQAAIWQLLHPEANFGFVSAAPAQNGVLLTPASAAIYNDALANGLNFVPTTGQVVAILMVPSAANPTYQGFVIPVPISCTGAAGGAVKLTKTANVTNANAFQAVTFTYKVTNTGTQPLTNIAIVDDNGTPAYTEDDVTINVSGTLAPGMSTTVTNTVYLPVSLFYQNGNSAAFDTLIPVSIPGQNGSLPSLSLTYLIDSDVSDNTYGSGASAGWSATGHTFQEELGNYAEFAFYDARGNLVSDFNVDYLADLGMSATYPSGYGVPFPSVKYGGSKYIARDTSTLAENLNGYAKFYSDTVNSPVGDSDWQRIAGYEVTVNDGIFGICGPGWAAVKKNYLTLAEIAYNGQDRCKDRNPVCYTPTPICANVYSTAYVCAQVCGCTTVVHAKACLTVKLNGCNPPSCNSISQHKCQSPTCGCQCSECKSGHCNSCSHVGCTDSQCHKQDCGHNTVYCKTTKIKYCW